MGLPSLAPKTSREFVKYFTPVRILKFSILPEKRVDRDIFDRKLRILDILLREALKKLFSIFLQFFLK